MKLPKFKVDATNMRLVFDLTEFTKNYSDCLKLKTLMENHMSWEIVSRNGNHLGVADYDTILGIFWSING